MLVEAQPISRSPRCAGGLHRVGVEALGGEDRPLVLRPAQRVLADRAVGPDDAVARHDQRHGVVAERRADGPDRLRPADLGGDPAVRPDLAARDVEGLAPDVLLELAVAAQVEVDAHAAVAPEPALDRPGQRGRQLVGRERPGDRSGPRGSRANSGGLHAADPAAVPGHEQRPDHGVHAGHPVGQPDLDEDVRGQRRRARSSRMSAMAASRSRLGAVGGHAVISSRSSRSPTRGGAQHRQAAVDLGLDGALGSAEGGGEIGIARGRPRGAGRRRPGRPAAGVAGGPPSARARRAVRRPRPGSCVASVATGSGSGEPSMSSESGGSSRPRVAPSPRAAQVQHDRGQPRPQAELADPVGVVAGERPVGAHERVLGGLLGARRGRPASAGRSSTGGPGARGRGPRRSPSRSRARSGDEAAVGVHHPPEPRPGAGRCIRP